MLVCGINFIVEILEVGGGLFGDCECVWWNNWVFWLVVWWDIGGVFALMWIEVGREEFKVIWVYNFFLVRIFEMWVGVWDVVFKLWDGVFKWFWVFFCLF